MGGGGERADVNEVQGKRDSSASLSLQPYQFMETMDQHQYMNQMGELALVCNITKMQPQVGEIKKITHTQKKPKHSRAKKKKKKSTKPIGSQKPL